MYIFCVFTFASQETTPHSVDTLLSFFVPQKNGKKQA